MSALIRCAAFIAAYIEPRTLVQDAHEHTYAFREDAQVMLQYPDGVPYLSVEVLHVLTNLVMVRYRDQAFWVFVEQLSTD